MVASTTLAVEIDEATNLAKDPRTSSRNLEELSRYSDRNVRRQVAFNPSTPENLLREMWVTWPEAILENPIIDVWELTGSVPLYEKLDREGLWSWYHYLIRSGQHDKINANIPESVRLGFPFKHRSLEYWLCEDPSSQVRVRLAGSSRYPEVQARLVMDPEREVRIALAENRHLSAYCHRVMASDPSKDVMIALAQNTHIKEDIKNAGFGILSFFEDEDVRAAAASNPKTPLDILERHCIRDESEKVKISAAMNPSLGKKLHREMQTKLHLDMNVRRERNIVVALASNRAADIDFLTELATSKNHSYRSAAAANPNTPEELQLALYNDDSEKVRNAFVGLHCCGKRFFDFAIENGSRQLKCDLAVKPGRTGEQLMTLAKDSDRRVRLAVVKRLQCGRFQHDTMANRMVVGALSRDGDPGIRKSMVTDHRLNESRLNEMAEDSDSNVRIAVACHYNTGRAGLALLVADKNDSVRHHAALTVLDKGWVWGRHNAILCDYDAVGLRSKLFMVKQLLKGLVHDPCLQVRRLLAGHTCTPAQILCRMLNDSDQQVRESIRKRSRFPRDEMIRLTREKPDWGSVGAGMTLNAKVLARLANQNNEYTRGLVARNCRTPVGVLRTLARDESEFVSAKLEENPKYIRNK